MDPIEEIGRHQICEQVGTESDTFGGHFVSYRPCWEAVRVTIKTNAVHPKRKVFIDHPSHSVERLSVGR